MKASPTAARDEPAGASKRLLDIALFGLCFYCLVQVIVHLAFVALPDGSSWQQGDWLINGEQVTVRRGIFGSWLIHLADATHWPLLQLTIAVQFGLLCVLLGLVAAVFYGRAPGLPHLLLLAAPGFVPLFWGSDPNGALRKEMVAFAALLLLVLALRKQDRGLYLAAAAVLALSFLGHELCVLFAPMFITLSVVFGWRATRDRLYLAGAAFVAAAGAAAMGFALSHDHVQTAAQICAPLLAHALPPSICQGAISYLATDSAANAVQVRANLLASGALGRLPLTVLIAAAPVLYVMSRVDRRLALVGWAALATVPFLPLYLIAVDWGRWIGLQVFALVVLTVASLDAGYVRISRPVSPVWATALLLPGLLVSPDHAMWSIRGGALVELLAELRRAFAS